MRSSAVLAVVSWFALCFATEIVRAVSVCGAGSIFILLRVRDLFGGNKPIKLLLDYILVFFG